MKDSYINTFVVQTFQNNLLFIQINKPSRSSCSSRRWWWWWWRGGLTLARRSRTTTPISLRCIILAVLLLLRRSPFFELRRIDIISIRRPRFQSTLFQQQNGYYVNTHQYAAYASCDAASVPAAGGPWLGSYPLADGGAPLPSGGGGG